MVPIRNRLARPLGKIRDRTPLVRMREARPSSDELLALVQQQQRQIQTLTAEVARLQAALKGALDFLSQTLRAFGNRFRPTPILLPTR